MLNKFFVTAFALAAAINSFASSNALASRGEGTGMGNGGDICEDRFKVVRDDIASWVLQGGSAGLALPQEISVEHYNAAILTQIANAKISCTDEKVMVGTAEKTCKNFVDSSGKSQILCNASRFKNTGSSDQYVLVHHEYAGLAGFEVNSDEESHYAISNQLTEYLRDQVVQKLGIKPRLPKARDLFKQASAATLEDLDVGTARDCDYYWGSERLDDQHTYTEIAIQKQDVNPSSEKPIASGIAFGLSSAVANHYPFSQEVAFTSQGVVVADENGGVIHSVRALANKTLIIELGLNTGGGIQSVADPTKWALGYIVCKATGKESILPEF
ncbi:MAG: hypothetical protein ACJ763_11545 [Bdellovibrionia bacterium]